MAWQVLAAKAAVDLAGGFIGGNLADRAAKKQARIQSQAKGLQRAEEKRMQQIQDRQVLGAARLATYASGLQMSGSNLNYINMLESEQLRRQDYIDKANLLEQQAIAAGAQGAGDLLRIEGITGALSSGVGAGYEYGVGKGWWT